MKQFYFVGNAHLDPAWMWRWQEGSAETKATLRSALDRMNEYPDFKFVCSSASAYEWIEDFDPAMFEEIKQRIREGRWIVVGGWYVQPDCNLPSGEGFARQSLYSQRYFHDRFGVTAVTGYNVDSFGHNLMLPQILKKSGMKQYVFMRPGPHEKEMPANAFRWRSPDGSEIPVYRIRACYNENFKELSELTDSLAELEKFQEGMESGMVFYGVGNHGGGPTKRNIELIMQAQKEFPENKYVFSDLNDYFESMEEQFKDLPLHTDDLQHHASGCYSAVSAVKAGIRRAENGLLEAEGYNMVAANVLGKKYLTEQFKDAWKNVLFCHFHDIAGGCSVEDVFTDSGYMLSESISIAERLKNSALQSLSWAIDTSSASRGFPIVVFNPHPFDIEDTVQINKQLDCIVDGEGNEVPLQHVQSQTIMCMGRSDTLFTARVPAMGYATYYYLPEAKVTHENTLKAEGNVLENAHVRVEFDPQTGYIRSMFNKDEQRQMLGGESAVPVIIDEHEHDTWSHARNFFTKQVGVFGDAKLTVLEKGPVRATVKVVSRYGASTLTQYFSLGTEDTTLTVRAKIDWQEHHKMLKLAYNMAVEAPRAFYEIPFGVIERPVDGEEEPGYRWVAVADDKSGYALLNNSKYSFSVKDSTLNLTVVRSPLYGDHGGARNDECVFTDQGLHEFTYAITEAKMGEWSPIITKARLFNTHATAVVENNHKGTQADTFCGLTVSAPNVQISAIKRAEDGQGLVVRMYETEGKETPVVVSGALLPASLSVTVAPWSIQTYLLKDGESTWREVLLTEFDM